MVENVVSTKDMAYGIKRPKAKRKYGMTSTQTKYKPKKTENKLMNTASNLGVHTKKSKTLLQSMKKSIKNVVGKKNRVSVSS